MNDIVFMCGSVTFSFRVLLSLGFATLLLSAHASNPASIHAPGHVEESFSGDFGVVLEIEGKLGLCEDIEAAAKRWEADQLRMVMDDGSDLFLFSKARFGQWVWWKSDPSMASENTGNVHSAFAEDDLLYRCSSENHQVIPSCLRGEVHSGVWRPWNLPIEWIEEEELEDGRWGMYGSQTRFRIVQVSMQGDKAQLFGLKYDWEKQAWTNSGTVLLSAESPAAMLWDLENYLVVIHEGAELTVMRKSDDKVTQFPSDNWSSDLLRKARQGVSFVSGNNVGFAPDLHAIEDEVERFDFDAHLAFAHFAWLLAGDRVTEGGSNTGMQMLLWAAACFLILGIGFWWYRYWLEGLGERWARRELRGVEAIRADRDEVLSAVPAFMSHWSQALQALMLHKNRVLSTAELDAVLGISSNDSEANRRRCRSRIVGAVNEEYDLIYHDMMITRVRSKVEKRRMEYHLAQIPAELRRIIERHRLQRHGMHEFHANDSAYGAHGIPKNGKQNADRSEGRTEGAGDDRS
jgi:hypothetical protein